MKLTTTQIALLKEAAEDRYGIAGFQFGYYTRRKNGCFGDRKMSAMKGLIEAGLATHRETYRSIHHGRGFASDCHSADVSFFITDAGREAIKAMLPPEPKRVPLMEELIGNGIREAQEALKKV